LRLSPSLRMSLRLRLGLNGDCDEWFVCCETLAAMCLTIVRDFDDFANGIIECEWFDSLQFWLRLSLSLRVILSLRLTCDCDEWFGCCSALVANNLTVFRDFDYFDCFENKVVECKWFGWLPFRFRLSLSLRVILSLRFKCDCNEWFGSFETLTTNTLTFVRDFDYFENIVVKSEWFDLLWFWLRVSLSQRLILRLKLKCDRKQRSRCWKAMTTKNLTAIFDFTDFARGVQQCEWFDLLQFRSRLRLKSTCVCDIIEKISELVAVLPIRFGGRWGYVRFKVWVSAADRFRFKLYS
jgi:uncharacterized protein YodC (DUF2158 family)